MASVTPLLDAQLLRLRRRLGDIYNEDGTAIDATNVYTSTTGTTWKQQELLDIYNDSIRSFMIYMIKMFPKEKWWEFMPGYVYDLENQTTTTGKLDLTTLSPTAFQLIDVKNHGTDIVSELANFIPPQDWFDIRAGLVKTRKPDSTHIFYTIMGDGANSGKSTLFSLPTSLTKVDLIYLKDHTDYVQNNASPGELNGLAQDTLRRVLIFAEQEARRWKSTEAADIPEAQMQSMMAMDKQGGQ